MATQTLPRDVLTQVEATERADRVSEAAYELAIDLRARAETYRGEATLRFRDSGAGDLFLEYRGRRIELLEINGQPCEPAWNGYRLTLPGDRLRDRNVVRVV